MTYFYWLINFQHCGACGPERSKANAGNVLFQLFLFLSSLFFLVSHVISLTAPETGQVIVCLVCVLLLLLIIGFDFDCLFVLHGSIERITEGVNSGEAAKAGKYSTGGIKDWTFRMISGPRERNIWILDTAAAQANELRGQVDWLVHDGDAAFFAFPFFLFLMALVAPFFFFSYHGNLFYSFSFSSLSLQRLFVFPTFSSRFCLFAVAFSLALQSDLPLAISKFSDTLFDIQIAILH